MNCDNEEIDISITIGNSHNWNIIIPGKTYYFNVKRNIQIIELLELFYENFKDEELLEIKRYSLFTKKMIKLNDDDTLDLLFNNYSRLDIIDKDISIFYAMIV
tara:strand:+ start:69 stop:377 length:309 start_codon:yes stop_codon:yes gene_type:complete